MTTGKDLETRLREVRLALFEVEECVPDTEKVGVEYVDATPELTAECGVEKVARRTFMDYAKLILAISAADGELADAEVKFFIDKAKLYRLPDGMIEEGMAFADQFRQRFSSASAPTGARRDPAGGPTVANLAREFLRNEHAVGYKKRNAAVMAVYDSIKMARADGSYADEERAAVRRAADIMGVSAETLAAVEELVDFELALETCSAAAADADERSGALHDTLVSRAD